MKRFFTYNIYLLLNICNFNPLYNFVYRINIYIDNIVLSTKQIVIYRNIIKVSNCILLDYNFLNKFKQQRPYDTKKNFNI